MSDSEEDYAPKRPRHTVQCYDWDFTFFGRGDFEASLETHKEFVNLIRPLFKKWTFQLEECPTTGKPHFQGRGSLFKKKRKGELTSLLNTTDLRGMYVTECSLESRTKEAFYTLKYDTKVDGPWSDRTWKEPAYIPRQFRGLLDRLHPFQRDILASKDDFDDRSVNLIVDKTGFSGKSTCACLAHLHQGGIDLPAINDHKELTQVVCDVLMGKNERQPGIIFIDLPRALTYGDNKKLAPFMVAIEQIKKGHVCDVRNHYREWWFDSPAVWVFCNHTPDLKHMSADRWRFWAITKSRELSKLSRQDVILSQKSQPAED